MSQDLQLYDLPTRGRCQSWSANTWRTRLILNYKKIPYHTVWVPYSKLVEILSKTGVPPGESAEFPYGTPHLVFPNGEARGEAGSLTTISTLAPRLEELYPSPPLIQDESFNEETVTAIGEAVGPLIRYFIPIVGRDVLIDEDRPWFRQNCAKYFGVPPDEVDPSPEAADRAWADAQPGFRRMCALLRERKQDEGPFILGSVPTYADFWILATIKMFKVLGEDPGQRFEGQGPELKALYEAGKEWMEKDD